jgi:hypothetical protein
VRCTPGRAGDLWIADGFSGNPGSQPGGGSLHHSTNSGATWTTISNVVEPYSVGFGAPKPGGGGYPSVYIVGWVSSVYGVWRSDDEGSTWKQLGPWPLNNMDRIVAISGDPNVWGKVYVGFAGSGYAYGQFNYLLKRDIDPLSRDNSPMWVERAA